MFVSQVIFESEIENEALLYKIMKKKMGDSEGCEGLVSAECWIKKDEHTYAFSLVTKWVKKENFKAWMAKTHAGGHIREHKNQEKPNIRKTGYQFEMAE